MTTKLAIVLAASTMLACGAAPPPRVQGLPREQGGHLLLVGGGEKPDEVLDLFVRLAGGSDGRIVILPLASEDTRETGAYYASLFRQHGAREVAVVHIDDARDAQRRAYVETIRAADGVWFAGGDQSRITSRMLDTPLLEALREMRERGGVVGGTSAGTACQSEIMLVGSGDEEVMEASNIATARGLGLFRGVIVDQHFVARQRQNRLLSVVLEHRDQVGVGIDEATAAWVRPDGSFQAVGRGTIFVFDAREARAARRDAVLGGSGIQLSVLVPGQRFDLRTGSIVDGPPSAYGGSTADASPHSERGVAAQVGSTSTGETHANAPNSSVLDSTSPTPTPPTWGSSSSGSSPASAPNSSAPNSAGASNAAAPHDAALATDRGDGGGA